MSLHTPPQKLYVEKFMPVLFLDVGLITIPEFVLHAAYSAPSPLRKSGASVLLSSGCHAIASAKTATSPPAQTTNNASVVKIFSLGSPSGNAAAFTGAGRAVATMAEPFWDIQVWASDADVGQPVTL